MGKYDSRGTKPQQRKLKKAVWSYLQKEIIDPHQEIFRELEEDDWYCMDFNPKRWKQHENAPLQDSGMWTSDDSHIEAYQESGAGVILHYDGSGHDYLSTDGGTDYPEIGWRHYEAIEKIATKLGWRAEAQNSWSTGFYWEG